MTPFGSLSSEFSGAISAKMWVTSRWDEFPGTKCGPTRPLPATSAHHPPWAMPGIPSAERPGNALDLSNQSSGAPMALRLDRVVGNGPIAPLIWTLLTHWTSAPFCGLWA